MAMDSINLIKEAHFYLEKEVRLFFYRKKAHLLTKQLVNKRGYRVVDREKMRIIKSYAKKTLGSYSYWPWLSLYTEVRGEFKSGWIPNDYYMAYLLKKYNPESIRISAYKTFDHKIFPDFALKPLIIKIGANFYDSSRRQIMLKEAENILFNFDDEVVIKEDVGFGGHDVNFIDSRKLDFDHYSYISSYIIQPAVCQHENLRALNSKSVNTLRVLTYLNGKGNIEIKYAYLRFGTGESRVDNTSSGGGLCFIRSDGNLTHVAYDQLGIEIGVSHPDTGILFESITIPDYKKLLQECIKSHKIFPYLKFIGWDVAINASGKAILLEWNSEPMIWIAEALKGPFWEGGF